ncbi:MAG: hypothetical protein C0432_05125 [Candidatus Puniceispirillum sp.]|nr:hypothetical protein [Candidatus Puniceispirillum sp.]
MFSMFFGSGNLTFPVLIGIEAQSSFIFSVLGFILTGVCLPLIGLLGIMFWEGDKNKYFSKLGKIPSFILTLIMLLLMGPIGIIPRSASLIHGSFETLIPSLSIVVFNFFFCILIAALIWQKNRVIEIIGIYFTPIKLGSIIGLIVISLVVANHTLTSGTPALDNIEAGIKAGYQTLDLIASFFFGSAIYGYIKQKISAQHPNTPESELKESIFKCSVKASFIGGGLLSLCYIGFVILGAKYAPHLADITGQKEKFLMVIAKVAMGNYAGIFVAITLFVSCLATCTIVASLFSDYLYEDIFKKKITREIAIVLTMGLSFTVSLLGFEAIYILLGTLLEWIYPLLMVYAIYMLVTSLMNYNKKNQSAMA